jgi:anti-sigma factor RsiW
VSGCRRIGPLLVRSVDADLGPEEALRLARHLDRCTACRILLARERRLAEALDGLEDALDVDPSFFEAVMASLPDRPARAASPDRASTRFRRGLKLAGMASITALGAGVAARVLPSLRFDLAAPSMPRFTPESCDGWLGLFGSAAQWVRVAAESLAWSGTASGPGGAPLELLAFEGVVVAAFIVVAASAGVALFARAGSRAS